jgi:hypothetical protein
MAVKLTFRRRVNMSGIPCVAPFIDGRNIWDIPEKEWTPAVGLAIASAYELGRDRMMEEMVTHLRSASCEPVMGQPWQEGT